MTKITLIAVLLAGAVAHAAPTRKQVKAALAEVKEASELLDDDDSRGCQKKAGARLDALVDALKELAEDPGHKLLKRARQAAENAKSAADDHCSEKVSRRLGNRIDKALANLDSDRERDRDGDDDDDDDARPSRSARPSARESSSHDTSFGPFHFSIGGSTEVSHEESSSSSSEPAAAPAPAPRTDGMDAAAFKSLMSSLKSCPNELTRKDIAISTVQQGPISSRQLGSVLDQFPNELLRLDVAKAGAPQVTDRGNAVALSSKFHNSILQAEYVQAVQGK